jgi:tetratricopeptide (TPR) repeat protein
MTTGMNEIIIFLSLALVVLWTVRMARSKGRNPYLWGGLALALMLIPSWPALLGMAPMIILLFIKSPQVAHQDVSADTVNCPKCRAVHAAGHTYCVNCGWELAKPYADEGVREEPRREEPRMEESPREEPRRAAEPPAGPPPAAAQPSPSTQQPVAGGSRPVEPPPPVAQSAPVSVPPAGSDGPIAEQTEEKTVTETSPPEIVTLKEPTFRRPITPETFMERGSDLFDQGKLQEALDQFNKAIALSPRHLTAWEMRAEAHMRLGQEKKAEEDQRHLEALRGQAPG